MRKHIIYMLAAVFLGIHLFSCPVRAEQIREEAGGIHILKTDLTGNVLEGAQFQILREPENGELADRDREKKMVKIGEEYKILVVEKVWDNRNMTGSLHTSVVTDRKGKAAAYGLPYGTYYLLEEKAPDGYNRITEPIRISVHKYSHLTEEDRVLDDKGEVIDNTLHIINVRYVLPDTGNWKLMQLTAACVGLLFSSMALILLNWRRWQ